MNWGEEHARKAEIGVCKLNVLGVTDGPTRHNGVIDGRTLVRVSVPKRGTVQAIFHVGIL